METVGIEETSESETTQRHTSAQQALNPHQVNPLRCQVREFSDVELIFLIAIIICAVLLFIFVIFVMLTSPVFRKLFL